MIQITEKAKEKLLLERSQNNLSENYKLRVAITKGGCSGLKYALKFDNEVRDTDEVLEDKDIKILVDQESLPYLQGSTLEFSDGLQGKGFFFSNPNVKKSCGCGESFEV